MMCQHCLLFPVSRSRGLCWSCFYRPGVRERYPPQGVTHRGLGMGRRRLPCEPTDAWPGTPEKIQVFMQRAARGEELFHADDPHLWTRVYAAVG